jgi:hypothetical protein
VPIARHARSCERHGRGASSIRIEAPSQSAQDPYHQGWTPLRSSLRWERKGLAMSLTIFIDDTCKPAKLSVIEAHPTSRHLAIHNYQCVDCGPVLAKIISLKQDEPSSLQTVT